MACVRSCSVRLLSGGARPTGPSYVRFLHGTPAQRYGAAADKSYQFVVCGGGAGGLAVASSLGRRFGRGKLAVIEPADVSRTHTWL